MVTFPPWITGCDFISPAILDLFLFSTSSIYSAVAFLPLENSDHFVVSVSIDSPSNSNGYSPFHRTAFDYTRTDGNGPRHHLRDVPLKNISKLGDSAAASKF